MTVVNVEGLSFQILEIVSIVITSKSEASDKPLVSSLRTKLDLHRNRNDIWTLGPNMLCLPQSLRLIEAPYGLSSKRILLSVLRNIFLKCSIMRTAFPVLLKVVRSARNFVLHPFTSSALLWICDRGQEITGCLARRALPAHIQEIVFGLIARAEKDFPAFIQDNGLVEDIIDCLRGLVDCNCVAAANQTCGYSE